MLKWTGALAAAAVVGGVVGFQASQLMKPVAPAGPEVTTTTVTGTATTAAGEQVFFNLWKEYGALKVFVKDGRITRMQTFTGEPTAVFHHAERYRTYSPDRLKYPMKRVGWEPGGKSSIANRGKGEFVRITWDEAYDLATRELKRIQQNYGPSAFLYAPGEHSNSWMFHNRYLFGHDMLSFLGGYTSLGCDGYSWGGNRTSGASVAGTTGAAGTPAEEVSFFLKYSKMFVNWSKDPLVNDIAMGSYEIVDDMRLFKAAGIKRVFIGGSMDETSKNFADTWIPCHPYGDEALAAAIAYVWITEGTYDQAYLDTHTIGFDEDHMPAGAPKNASVKSYIMGLSDGIKKTPEWAEPICGVKPRIIRALAREWASKPTGLQAWRGCRTHGGQFVRSLWTLMAMQGLGKPGRGAYGAQDGSGGRRVWRDGIKGYASVGAFGETNFPQHDTTGMAYRPNTYPFYHVIPPELCGVPAPFRGPKGPMTSDPKNWPGKWPGLAESHVPNPIRQVIRDVLWGVSMDASPDKPIFHRYTMGDSTYLYQYPLPGHSEAHAYFPLGGNYLERHPYTYGTIKAFMHPKMEFIMSLDPWMEADCKFADLLLPTVTNFERCDVSNWGLYSIYCQKCIEPLFESKSDFDIWVELAKRMGVFDKFSTGPIGYPTPLVTEDDWLKMVYNTSTTLTKFYTWEEFKKIGYHKWQLPDTWHSFFLNSWNWKKFYEDPKNKVPNTPTPESGLIELYSQSTVKIGALGQSGYYVAKDPDMTNPDTKKYESPNPGPDPLVPGIGTYIPNPEGPGTPRGQKYPIAVMTSHPKFWYHTSYPNVKWLQDEIRKNIGGYMYMPIRMSRKDADDRGIKYGDLVRVFNDRGQILCWAYVSERFMPGVAHITYGVWNDYVEPGVPGALDKSGNVENICTGGFLSPFDNQANVQAVAQVEKWTG